MEELMNNVGLCADLAGLLREQFMRTGFTREEAVRMSMEFIKMTIQLGLNNKED